jgi:hypothetical protein
MVPSLIRDVRAATTASTSQGSMIGGPSPLSENTMWSHTKNPSNPASSAATPSSISPAGSSPKLGTATPRSRRSVTGRC